ncbi:MAG: sensor histidine kinase, partial [Gammaproteobacteria bacterium]
SVDSPLQACTESSPPSSHKTTHLRLTHQIFFGVSTAVLLPLVLLLAFANFWSESVYREQVAAEINGELSQWVAEIDRKRSFDREMITALANTPEVKHFLPVLEATVNDEIHSEVFERSEELDRFLEGFSTAIPSLSALRVLDVEGNSVIRIRFQAGEPTWEPELEAPDPELVERLKQMPDDEVSYLNHPALHADFEQPPLHDAIYPLQYNGQRVGYLVAIPNGGDVDRVLDFTARPYGGRIFVFELNPANVLRDGLILYDDRSGARMGNSGAGRSPRREQDTELRSVAQAESFGVFVADSEPRMVFFQEYHPYPRRLISWVVGVRIDSQGLAAPFERIQYGIVSFGVLALLAILVLVRMITQRFARPVETIGTALTDYANRGVSQRMPEQGPEEIQALSRAFNQMTQQLDKARGARDRAEQAARQNAKLASIGQIAAGIGHELNNPLSHILTLSRLMEKSLRPEDKELREDLESLREEAQRASRIVAGVLEFARQREINAEYFDPAPWLDDCLRNLERSASAHGLSFSKAVSTDEIYGDPEQLRQVMMNLLDNAIHASPAGSSIQITIHAENESSWISIRDQGSGISDEHREQLFDPFFTTKPVGEGTGLGLSISLGIVEQHGGELRLENREEGGTRATVRLPAGEPAP